MNEIYERYVPSSWTKPTPDADQHQREHWILAKYTHRYSGGVVRHWLLSRVRTAVVL